jgi:hypothetical protein
LQTFGLNLKKTPHLAQKFAFFFENPTILATFAPNKSGMELARLSLSTHSLMTNMHSN